MRKIIGGNMGWIGAFFLFAGRRLIGRDKVKAGLILSFIGDALWVIVGWQISRFDVIFTAGVMAFLDLDGWYNERKKDKYWNSFFIHEKRVRWWQIWK